MNFLDRISQNIQISNFIKIRPVGAKLFHADRRKDGRTWRSWQLLFAILRKHDFSEAGRFRNVLLVTTGIFLVNAGDTTQVLSAVRTVTNKSTADAICRVVCSVRQNAPCLYWPLGQKGSIDSSVYTAVSMPLFTSPYSQWKLTDW